MKTKDAVTAHETIIEVLNDLIKINNDRIAGYEKAAHEANPLEGDIRSLFYKMSTESRAYVNDLHSEVLKLGGAPVTGTTMEGKLYRFWIGLKTSFGGDDMLSLLASCEYGEDNMQKAYREAYEASIGFPDAIITLIEQQRSALRRSHDLIKKYRDQYASAK